MFFCFVFIGSLSLRFYFEIGILQSHHCLSLRHWCICGTTIPPIPYQSHLRLRSSLTLQLVWHSCCCYCSYWFFVYWLAVKQSALAYCSSTGRVTTLTKTTLTKAMVWMMFVVVVEKWTASAAALSFVRKSRSSLLWLSSFVVIWKIFCHLLAINVSKNTKKKKNVDNVSNEFTLASATN